MVNKNTRVERVFGSDLIVDYLSQLGISYVAFNPGATFRGIHDSLVARREVGAPEIIECLHEEISVAIAHGYAKASGRPMGVLLHNVVGLLHGGMAIFNAWCDQVPILLMGGTGPMDSTKRRPQIDWIHTALVQGNLVRDYVKWDDQPYSLAAVSESLWRGYRTCTSEPKGPVYICFDAAIQEQEISEAPAQAPLGAIPVAPQVSGRNLQEVAELLVNAQAPVVIADRVGRSGQAGKALVELAEIVHMPVVEPEKHVHTLNFPTAHELNLTGANTEILAGADLVLALEMDDLFGALHEGGGTGFTSLIKPGTKIISIGTKDLQRNSLIQGYQRFQAVDLALTADVSQVLPELAVICREAAKESGGQRRTERRRQLAEESFSMRQQWWHKANIDSSRSDITRKYLALAVWQAVKGSDVVVANGSLKRWVQRLWDLRPDQWLGGSGGSGLGYGMGASIGAALAFRGSDRLIINLQADGDFLFTPSALWTAAHYQLPVLTIMDNNRGYYNSFNHQNAVGIHRGRSLTESVQDPEEHMQSNLEHRSSSIDYGVDPGEGTLINEPAVDFAALARSFGVEAEGPVTSPEMLPEALERAVRFVITEKRPFLLDVTTVP